MEGHTNARLELVKSNFHRPLAVRNLSLLEITFDIQFKNTLKNVSLLIYSTLYTLMRYIKYVIFYIMY